MTGNENSTTLEMDTTRQGSHPALVQHDSKTTSSNSYKLQYKQSSNWTLSGGTSAKQAYRFHPLHILSFIVGFIMYPVSLCLYYKKKLPAPWNRFPFLVDFCFVYTGLLWTGMAFYIPTRLLSGCWLGWAEWVPSCIAVVMGFTFPFIQMAYMTSFPLRIRQLYHAVKEALGHRLTTEFSSEPGSLKYIIEQRWNQKGTTMSGALSTVYKEQGLNRDVPIIKPEAGVYLSAWTPLRIASVVGTIMCACVYPVTLWLWMIAYTDKPLGADDSDSQQHRLAAQWNCAFGNYTGFVACLSLQLIGCTAVYLVAETLRTALHFAQVALSDINWLVAIATPGLMTHEIDEKFRTNWWVTRVSWQSCLCGDRTQIPANFTRFNPIYNVDNLRSWWYLRSIHREFAVLNSLSNHRGGCCILLGIIVGIISLLLILTTPVSPILLLLTFVFNFIVCVGLILLFTLAMVNTGLKQNHLRLISRLLVDLQHSSIEIQQQLWTAHRAMANQPHTDHAVPPSEILHSSGTSTASLPPISKPVPTSGWPLPGQTEKLENISNNGDEEAYPRNITEQTALLKTLPKCTNMQEIDAMRRLLLDYMYQVQHESLTGKMLGLDISSRVIVTAITSMITITLALLRVVFATG